MIDVKIDLNKSLNSFSNRIKVRQGDVGEKMRITLTDNKFSLENQNNLQVKFEGNIRSGDYVEGIAIPFNDKAGEFVYQFKSEDVSIPGAYQRAFIRVYDESGNRISSEDIFVEVLKDADISNNQSKIYVSKLDELLEDFDDDFGEFLTGKEEDYSALDEKSKELNSELSDLKKGSNEIKNTQTEIIQSIEDNDLATKNDLETAKQESSANVIYQLVGKEKVRMTFTADFSNKESGSDDKNPHWASAVYGLNELPSPSDFKTELVQLRYDSLKILDGQKTIVNTVAGTANQYPCLEHKWDIVEIIKRELSEDFFVDRGAIDKASQATVAKKIIVSPLESSAWGFGTCPSGNSLKIANHINGVGWQTDQLPPNTTNLVKQITARNTATPSIDDEGFLRTIIYTEASSKTVQSQINVDYGNLVFSIEISMNEHIKSMMAANHGEKIATQEEAEAGTDNTKTMTPLRTAQQLEKKAVTIAGNQTIGGIKNFKDGLMINDVSLSTITRKVIYEADGVGGYFNAADKFTLGASGKIDKIVLLWSRVDDTAGTLLNYSWSQTVLSPDDLVVGNSYRIQMTTDNYKFVTFANESGNVTISGANENSVAPNRIYRIKRIIAYLKN